MSTKRSTDEHPVDSASQEAKPHNLCFTYPQGPISVIPQILTLMAVVASLLAFAVFQYSDNFMCYQFEVENQGVIVVEDFICAGLELTNTDYWADPNKQGLTDDPKGWAGAIQAAAVFGILAASGGFVAFGLLLSATCFELSVFQLLMIWIIQAVCAVFCIITLVAGAADVCKRADEDFSDGCSVENTRLDTGAAFMIFACLLYVAAMVMTLLFWRKVRHDKKHASPEETRALVGSGGSHAGAPGTVPSGAVSVTTITLPDGNKRIEREYIDEHGQKVKEVHIEHTHTEDDSGIDL